MNCKEDKNYYKYYWDLYYLEVEIEKKAIKLGLDDNLIERTAKVLREESGRLTDTCRRKQLDILRPFFPKEIEKYEELWEKEKEEKKMRPIFIKLREGDVYCGGVTTLWYYPDTGKVTVSDTEWCAPDKNAIREESELSPKRKERLLQICREHNCSIEQFFKGDRDTDYDLDKELSWILYGREMTTIGKRIN